MKEFSKRKIKLGINFYEAISDYLECFLCYNKFTRFIRRNISAKRVNRIDTKNIPVELNEIRLFMVVKDESVRLPYIIKYYFERGIDRIFIIDNGSTDTTIDFLLKQDKVHIFQTTEHYAKHPNWIDLLLHKYGVGHWCLVVDSDEFLVYPHSEKVSIREICNFLDRYGYTALRCLLLDMYSNKPVNMTHYELYTNPLASAQYFDPYSHCKLKNNFPEGRIIFRNRSPSKIYSFIGGMRRRVFGLDKICLTKFPLIKFNPRMFLWAGTHVIEGAFIANIQGTLLHFKFFSSIIHRLQKLNKANKWWEKECTAYKKYFDDNPDLNLYYDKSVKYKNSEQLQREGILQTSIDYEEYAEGLK